MWHRTNGTRHHRSLSDRGVEWMIGWAVVNSRLLRRRQHIYRAYRQLGYQVNTPGDAAGLPSTAVAHALAASDRYWRRWLAAEVALSLALGPAVGVLALGGMLWVLAAWLTESAWAMGMDVSDAAVTHRLAQVLIRQLAALWTSPPSQPGRVWRRYLIVGWGQEWRWGRPVIRESRRQLSGRSGL